MAARYALSPPRSGALMAPVSVVIPVYNKSRSVARAIASVLVQLRSGDELIVVDDGSSDDGAERAARALGGTAEGLSTAAEGEREVLHQESGGVRVRLLSQPNRGVAAARNRGVATAGNEYIAFLDADDRWEDGARAAFAALLEGWPQAWGFSLGHSRVDPPTTGAPSLAAPPTPVATGLTQPQQLFGAALIRHYARYSGIINASSVVLHRTVFDQLGGFPEHADNGEDVVVWLAVALAGGSFVVDPQPYVVIERAVTSELPPLRRQPLAEHLARYSAPTALRRLPTAERRALRYLLYRNGLRHVAGNILRGPRSDGWTVARRLIRLGPKSCVAALLLCLTPRGVLRAAYRHRAGQILGR